MHPGFELFGSGCPARKVHEPRGSLPRLPVALCRISPTVGDTWEAVQRRLPSMPAGPGVNRLRPVRIASVSPFSARLLGVVEKDGLATALDPEAGKANLPVRFRVACKRVTSSVDRRTQQGRSGNFSLAFAVGATQDNSSAQNSMVEVIPQRDSEPRAGHQNRESTDKA